MIGFLYPTLRPLLFALPAETAHNFTLSILETGLVPLYPVLDDPILHSHVWGLRFDNPVGLAAGFDKNAQVPDIMARMGFGFVETGTVTPLPQPGNPRPRIFRAPTHKALINRMGFPNKGLDHMRKNLLDYRKNQGDGQTITVPLGINIGMNKDAVDPVADYRTAIRTIGAYADYIAVNISSPNTPNLRSWQEPENFKILMSDLLEERDRLPRTADQLPLPVLVKFAPDISEEEIPTLSALCIEMGVNGIMVGNTTIGRPKSMPAEIAREKGGLSGPPLRKRSCDLVGQFYRHTHGKIPIIGIGGVGSGADAYAFIRAGASLVQLYTALVYEGPDIVRLIRRDLAEYLRKDGFNSLGAAVGADHALLKKDMDYEGVKPMVREV